MRTLLRGLGQPLLLIATVGVVASLVAGAGALLLPGRGYRPEAPGTALPSVDELEGATAVMLAGADRRIVLERLRESEITDEGTVRFLFQGPEARLLVTAPARSGETIAGEQVEVLFVLDRTNYFPKGCTLELASLEPAEPVWDSVNGWMAGPLGAGTLDCRVEKIGEPAFPIAVVFRLEQIPS